LTPIAELKNRYFLFYRSLSSSFGLSYTTLMRWKRRLDAVRATVKIPGSEKLWSLDLEQLRQKKIPELKHGEKRVFGVGWLYSAFNGAISRRHLNRMISND
jgi:hypothetical protein